jgi:hypothetical protein
MVGSLEKGRRNVNSGIIGWRMPSFAEERERRAHMTPVAPDTYRKDDSTAIMSNLLNVGNPQTRSKPFRKIHRLFPSRVSPAKSPQFRL